ncbi:hypothetical protein B0J12DRAFT_229340 [Macrophomina phaseolina]|uniref:Uncharacterized protein n=1 Tax=Macrophomina phaseolina TaxID=35725 RepID=A0ABQ8GPR7_9PEZI|nr:hypothetical protein B0J12DRAFT_229340 [Macrophomina phaseolina]
MPPEQLLTKPLFISASTAENVRLDARIGMHPTDVRTAANSESSACSKGWAHQLQCQTNTLGDPATSKIDPTRATKPVRKPAAMATPGLLARLTAQLTTLIHRPRLTLVCRSKEHAGLSRATRLPLVSPHKPLGQRCFLLPGTLPTDLQTHRSGRLGSLPRSPRLLHASNTQVRLACTRTRIYKQGLNIESIPRTLASKHFALDNPGGSVPDVISLALALFR